MLVFRLGIKVQHTKQKQCLHFTSLEVLNNRKEKQRQHFNSSEAYLGSGLPVVGLCQWKLFQPCHSLQRTVILIFCPTHQQLTPKSTRFADIQRGNLISGTVRSCLRSWPSNRVFFAILSTFCPNCLLVVGAFLDFVGSSWAFGSCTRGRYFHHCVCMLVLF